MSRQPPHQDFDKYYKKFYKSNFLPQILYDAMMKKSAEYTWKNSGIVDSWYEKDSDDNYNSCRALIGPGGKVLGSIDKELVENIIDPINIAKINSSGYLIGKSHFYEW